MTDDIRLLLLALAAVRDVIVLIARIKLHPFVALVVVRAGGSRHREEPRAAVKHSRTAWATVLGFIAVVLGLGTCSES